jgi:hypothetical protein
MTGTRLKSPLEMAAPIDCGMIEPSTTGMYAVALVL